MSQATDLLARYLHLARASSMRRQASVRDRLLVLAAVLANELSLPQVAADCRTKVLLHNRRHMLRRWPTVSEAMQDERFIGLVQQLRRRYSPELVEHMFSSLGLELGNERQLYASDEEYGLALLSQVPKAAASSAASFEQSASSWPAADSKLSRFGTAAWLLDWGPFALGVIALTAVAAVYFLRS